MAISLVFITGILLKCLPGLHALALCQAKKINFAIKRVIILLAYLDLAKNKLYFAMELTYK